jgi:hypothetical protein
MSNEKTCPGIITFRKRCFLRRVVNRYRLTSTAGSADPRIIIRKATRSTLVHQEQSRWRLQRHGSISRPVGIRGGPRTLASLAPQGVVQPPTGRRLLNKGTGSVPADQLSTVRNRYVSRDTVSSDLPKQIGAEANQPPVRHLSLHHTRWKTWEKRSRIEQIGNYKIRIYQNLRQFWKIPPFFPRKGYLPLFSRRANAVPK